MSEQQFWLLERIQDIRESQIEHGVALQHLRVGQEDIKKLISGDRAKPISKPLTGALSRMKPLHWLVVLLTMTALLKGHDPSELLKLLSML